MILKLIKTSRAIYKVEVVSKNDESVFSRLSPLKFMVRKRSLGLGEISSTLEIINQSRDSR